VAPGKRIEIEDFDFPPASAKKIGSHHQTVKVSAFETAAGTKPTRKPFKVSWVRLPVFWIERLERSGRTATPAIFINQHDVADVKRVEDLPDCDDEEPKIARAYRRQNLSPRTAWQIFA